MPQNPLEVGRVLAGTTDNEDAAIVRMPSGMAMVQTLDFFTPIVNDPYLFGQIAAANSLSDVYAMGGEPWTAMNILCYPIKELSQDILAAMLQGGADKILEAGAVLVGGHSVEDDTIKYGLSVTGIVDPDNFARNAGLRVGDRLLLTKPLGSGILATAVKAEWEGAAEHELELGTWAAHLNKVGGRVIKTFGLRAATDVTGFGLGGHLIEMARASDVGICLETKSVPLMKNVYDLAAVGLVPEGSHNNRNYFACGTHVADNVDPLLVDIIFDAQTSGGLVLAIPEAQYDEAVAMLEAEGELVAMVGTVVSRDTVSHRLMLVP